MVFHIFQVILFCSLLLGLYAVVSFHCEQDVALGQVYPSISLVFRQAIYLSFQSVLFEKSMYFCLTTWVESSQPLSSAILNGNNKIGLC